MQNKLLGILEGLTVKLVLYLLKVSGGFATFFITQLTELAFDKLIVPLVKILIVKGHLVYDTTQGKMRLRRLKVAREENNSEDYDSTIDDILG